MSTQSVDRVRSHDKSQTWTRLACTIPFFVLFAVATQKLQHQALGPVIEPIAQSRQFNTRGLGFTIPRVAFLPAAFDDFIRAVTVAFGPAIYELDEVSRLQLLVFLTDFGTVVAILYIEAARRVHAGGVAAYPTVFLTLAQLSGAGLCAGPWLALVWATSPLEKYRGPGARRSTDSRFVKAVPVAMAVAYYLPHLVMFFAGSAQQRFYANYIWQFFPITASIVQYALVYSDFTTRTAREGQESRESHDSGFISYTVGTLVAVSAFEWAAVLLSSRFSAYTIFMPTETPSEGFDLIDRALAFLRWDFVLAFGSFYLWIAYSFWDMKAAAIVSDPWLALALFLVVSTSVVGPGATVGLFWLYREHSLRRSGNGSEALGEIAASKAD